ncbi:MAG TPA: TIGR02710 family CRISPR-associated protein [Deltaproteobacteria bacterium]|nr:TIGR02710 family CRISPR-associated protein [Deltaproteobacteria bacterium]
MKKILIVSVGGSPQPVVNAVLNHKPDFVYFFCSKGSKGSAKTIDGPGEVCGDTRTVTCPDCGSNVFVGDPKGKSISVQTSLSESQYEILVVEDPDDLTECYRKLTELNEKIVLKYGDDCKVIANYTGGTKTMSVAMAMAAVMTEKWDLAVNKGPRPDLIKVKDGDTPVIIDKWGIYCRNQMNLVMESIGNFDYAFAEKALMEMLGKPIEKALQTQLIEMKVICQAFDSWDKFDHKRALNLISNYGDRYSRYLVALKRILGKFRDSSGYEMVGDLLNNAGRRAHRGYYDDAVARIYRAVELFAQTRLRKEYGLDTAEMGLDDIPECIRSDYENRVRENGRILLGLKDDYMLLYKLEDQIGRAYKAVETKFVDALTRRNKSIGAHGIIPLDRDDYVFVNDTLGGFIASTAGESNIDIKVPQLPQDAEVWIKGHS